MKVFVEMMVQLPADHKLKRNDRLGDLCVRRVHQPHPRNIESGVDQLGHVAEIDGKIEADSTELAMLEAWKLLGQIDGLDEKAVIDLSIQPSN